MSQDQQSPAAVPRHVQAAKASWMAPLLAMVVNAMVGLNAQESSVKLIVGVFSLLMIFTGLAFALFAIATALRKGPLRILFPAGIGLLFNGFLVYSAFYIFQLASQVAEERRAQDVAVVSTDWIPTGDDWHVDRNAQFAIQFPQDWEVVPNPQKGVAVVALSPPESEEDEFRENITILTGRIPPRMDHKTFLARDLEDLRNNTAGFQEYGRGTKSFQGIEWFWIDYRQVIEGIETRVMGWLAIHHGRTYVVFCTRTPERPDAFREEFEKSVASIRTP